MGTADLWNNFFAKKMFLRSFVISILFWQSQFESPILKKPRYILLIKFPNGGAMCQNPDVEANCI